MALIHHWKLNETDGTTATATVGTNGTYARDAFQTKRFIGPGNGITVSQEFVAASADAVTIAPGTFAAGSVVSFSIFAKFNLSTGNLWGIAGDGTGIRKNSDTEIQVIGEDAGDVVFTVDSLGTTSWHHILVTFSAANAVRVFIDGVESGTGAQTLAEARSMNRIGRRLTTSFTGYLAWAKVFNSDESANAAALYAEAIASAAAIPQARYNDNIPARRNDNIALHASTAAALAAGIVYQGIYFNATGDLDVVDVTGSKKTVKGVKGGIYPVQNFGPVTGGGTTLTQGDYLMRFS
jgi:hypothetical protein